MDQYHILLYLLFLFAALDLIVGVSNDAVNFLNSAIGSKVASFRTIMIVASLGIILGALFSSGMMEVARKGIFMPGFFTFETIMYVFLAVMLTDIILLDLYNTLGLPTSTTVSIVFELLGAAFMIGLMLSFSEGKGFEQVESFINFESAFRIILWIFLSVILAFSIGGIVQYFTRLAFTFDFEANLKKYGAFFSGTAITAISYFLIIKGAKGSSFSDSLVWMIDHTWTIVFISFVFWTVVMALIIRYTRINPLKVIVLLGTFALAMSFAGNDLVNFIGVAVAAKQAVAEWSSLGGGIELAQTLKMSHLNESQETEFTMLFAAGLIMVVTLWFSAKARKVTETEVGLSRQDGGEEKFRPNMLSRMLVGGGMALGDAVKNVMGRELNGHVEKRFLKENLPSKNTDDDEAPAFDLLRASVNLMMASILISYATSLKLPLSTTYVSFMVAMGTSLADKAWGRESAVYRVAGVLNVIGGWLLTALIAFVSASLMGLIIYFGGFWAIIGLTAVAGFLLIRSHVRFRAFTRDEQETRQMFARPVDIENVIDESKINTARNMDIIRKSTLLSFKSLVGENKDILVRSFKQLEKLHKKNEQLQGKIIKYVKKMDSGNTDAGRLYILVFDLMQDMSQSANLLSEACTKHVMNLHQLPDDEYLNILIDLDKKLDSYLTKIIQSIDHLNFHDHEAIDKEHHKLMEFINLMVDRQIEIIQAEQVSGRNGLLQTKILLETKDIVESAHKILGVYIEYAREDVEVPEDKNQLLF